MPVLLAQSFLFTFSTESSKRIVRDLARFLYHPHPWTTASLNLFRHPSSFCIEALLCHNGDLVLTRQGFKIKGILWRSAMAALQLRAPESC